MHEEDISKVMNLVFQYLSSPYLDIVAKVSRTWDTIAYFEKLQRNTYFYIFDIAEETFAIQSSFKNTFKHDDSYFLENLGVVYTNNSTFKSDNHELRCVNRELCSFVVNIGFDRNVENLGGSDILYWLIFPIYKITNVRIFSFINPRLESKLPCDLLQFSNEGNDSWFGSHDMIIWLGVVDKLSICRNVSDERYCQIDTEFVFMFINNPSMAAYLCYLSEECDNAVKIRTQLRNLRPKINFWASSAAIMHVSYLRLSKLYQLDEIVFREVFPDVTLHPIYGIISSCGFSLHEFIELPKWWSLGKNEEKVTTIIILSGQS
ncbi:hypothetical protein M0802_010422 [Mischocyttarus mexicanus]|nr:hypothetical protein M0802_010422 [Mischocyttarus mexicanus]